MYKHSAHLLEAEERAMNKYTGRSLMFRHPGPYPAGMVRHAQNPHPGNRAACGGSLDALRAGLQVPVQDKACG